MRRILIILLSFCFLIFAVQPAEAAVTQGFLFPGNGDETIARNIGIKGMEIFLRQGDGDPLAADSEELPLDVNNAAVTLSIINPDTGITETTVTCSDSSCRNNLNPLPGQVGFAVDDGVIPNGVDETIRVVYNGFFPDTFNVQVAVENVTDALGDDFDLAGSDWSFTTTDTPPRDPINLALVLDRSGSMNSPTTGGGPTKIDALKQAAGILLDTILPYALPEIGDTPGDKVGVIYFNQDEIPKQLPDEMTLADINSANITAFKNTIIAPEPAGGSTSIGDGLLGAETAFSQISNPTNKILLFTDGKQNTLARVEEDDTFSNDAVRDLNIRGEDDIIQPFNLAYDICVISVGIGDAARRDFNSLVSRKRCSDVRGNFVDTLDVDTLDTQEKRSELIQKFLTVLQETVVGDKLEKVKVIQGAFNPGETKTEEFTLSEQDTRLSLVLTWSNPQLRSLDVLLKSPNGVEIKPDRFTRKGNQYSVISFILPTLIDSQLVSPAGQWKLVINPPAPVIINSVRSGSPARNTNSSSPFTTTLSSASSSCDRDCGSDYSVIVLADNRTIATEYRFGNSDPGTRELLPIRVKLTEAGNPIKGATVIAQVTAPNEGVGNLLSQTSIPRITSAQVDSSDPLSPAEKKLAALLQDPDILEQLLQSPRSAIKLEDNNGDGIYAGEFPDTAKEGIYNFTYLIEGIAPENGPFTRTEKRSLHVRTKPTPETTTVEVEILNGGKLALIKFTLFDALGNYLGPGYGDFIRVTSDQGRLIRGTVDNVDGSYQQLLALTDPSANPVIKVNLLGTTVVNNSLKELQRLFIEAENMDLDAYLVEANDFASGKELISLKGASKGRSSSRETGTASTKFTGLSGLYNIVVCYFDDNDGKALLRLKVNDKFVDNWSLDQNLKSDSPDELTIVRRTIGNVKLEAGDILTIEGTKNNGDFARVDFIQLNPINVR